LFGLQQALRTREDLGRHWRFEDYDNALFRDDAGLNGHAIFDACTAAHIPAVLKQKKPVQFWASWLDANTADEAINRFRSTPGVPTELFITPNDHSGGVRLDPLLPGKNDPIPSIEEQDVERLRFAAEAMGTDIPERYSARIIHYYVLGTGRYLDTLQWPPTGVENTKFQLSPDRTLVRTAVQKSGIDSLRVNFQASTGKRNRWYQLATPDYGDRSIQDTKILTYDTPPLERDTEVCGWPVVNLHMRTQTEDPTVFAYLEDVAPEGRVTYLTEGILRAIHRKVVADVQQLPYYPGPSPHSFARADAQPVVPGQDFTISLKLFAIAALIRKDHRIRLAIAGADADTFRPIRGDMDERFDIHCGGPNPSTFEVPLRAWQA
jgi:putative CocE/NonD family hydrolase